MCSPAVLPVGRQCAREFLERELSDDGSAMYRIVPPMHGRAIHGVVVGQVGPEARLERSCPSLGEYNLFLF